MYEEMTFEAIQQGMLDRVREDVDKREGSVIWDATAAVAYRLAELYFQMGNYPDLIFPDTSAELYLDRFAAPFGVERKAAVKAVRKVASKAALEIGSRWQGEESTFVIISQTAQEEYTAECEQYGTVGNQYFGALQPIYGSAQGEAALGEILEAGTEQETDDALRRRLLEKLRRPSTSGNIHDYYNWAMSCAGVGAARIFPLADGPGTVKVILADEQGKPVDAATAQSAAAYIESVRPIGADVTVSPARERQINVTAVIKLAAGATLGAVESAFTEAADGYLRGRAFGLDYVSLARLGGLLLDVAGVEDYSGLKINGALENLAVEPEEIAVLGTVRLEAG